MLINGHLIEQGSVLECEFCVIGTGMGGATVARKLAASRRDVLLVEAGGIDGKNDNAAINAKEEGRPFGLTVSRSIALGGTSCRWHGICAPLDEVDFEQRSWIAGSGWPMTRADLMPHYLEAAAALNIPGNAYFDSDQLGAELRTRLNDIEFDSSVLRPKLFQYRKPPQRWQESLLAMAKQGQLRCLFHAAALELKTDESGERVDELIVGAGQGTAVVRAKVFIVCAGALETPRLLLNSRQGDKDGLGNSYDLVGRYLSDHPMGHFCKLKFHRPTSAPLYSSLTLPDQAHLMTGLMVAPEQQRRHALANHYVWFRPAVTAERINDELLLSFLAVRNVLDLRPRQIAALLTNRDLLYRIAVHRFGLSPKYRYGDLVFMTEQLPNPNSRVRLSGKVRDGYNYPVSQIEWDLMEEDFRGFEAYTKVLFEQGLRSKKYTLGRVDEAGEWRRTVNSAAHHLGTARMAASPRHGVVDRNQKVFGVSNLFVGDGSVFPTVGAVNPSLTIVALGLRLGDHLLREAALPVNVAVKRPVSTSA